MSKERIFQWQEWEKGKFPSPRQVLEAALNNIQRDGSVLLIDDEGEVVRCQSAERIDLEALSTYKYEMHMLNVARSVMARVINIAANPEERDTYLATLAVFLASYRHDIDFLLRATDLVSVDEDGILQHPRRPSLSSKG